MSHTRRARVFFFSIWHRNTYAVAGNAITSASSVTAGAKLTRRACAMLCSPRNCSYVFIARAQRSIRQAWPAFQQGDKNLIPVVPRWRLNRDVVGLVLLIDFARLANSHLAETSPLLLVMRSRGSARYSASLACATL